MTVYYWGDIHKYTRTHILYRLFPFPHFCETTQRLIFLPHPLQFIIQCHPNTRQYPRTVSASGSQSFFWRDALNEWRPNARNTWRMTTTYAKHLKNDVHMRETLEEWRPHARNTWRMTPTCAEHLKNDAHMRETLEEWRPHALNTWRMTSTILLAFS